MSLPPMGGSVPFHGSTGKTFRVNVNISQMSKLKQHPDIARELGLYLEQHPTLILLMPKKQIKDLSLRTYTHDGIKTTLLKLYLDQVIRHDWEDYTNIFFQAMNKRDLLFGSIQLAFHEGSTAKTEELKFLGSKEFIKSLESGKQIWFWHAGVLKAAVFKGVTIIDHGWRYNMQEQISGKDHPLNVIIRYVDPKNG